MWKNRAKRWMAVLLSAVLLSTNMQAIQSVYAAQQTDEKDPVWSGTGIEEASQTEEVKTDLEEAEELPETDSTDALQPKETETESVLTVSEEEGELSETDNADGPQPKETQTVSEEEKVEEIKETEPTEQMQSEEETATEEIEEAEEPVVFSEVIVNPLYEDIIDKAALESEIEAVSEREGRKSSRLTIEVESNQYDSIESAATYVRKQMVERNSTITFTISKSLYNADNETDDNIIVENIKSIINSIVENAVEHTENCSGQEGDALRWGYGGYEGEFSVSAQSAEITCTFMYYTTYEQE